MLWIKSNLPGEHRTTAVVEKVVYSTLLYGSKDIIRANVTDMRNINRNIRRDKMRNELFRNNFNLKSIYQKFRTDNWNDDTCRGRTGKKDMLTLKTRKKIYINHIY